MSPQTKQDLKLLKILGFIVIGGFTIVEIVSLLQKAQAKNKDVLSPENTGSIFNYYPSTTPSTTPVVTPSTTPVVTPSSTSDFDGTILSAPVGRVYESNENIIAYATKSPDAQTVEVNEGEYIGVKVKNEGTWTKMLVNGQNYYLIGDTKVKFYYS